ncbi:MAG TPA: hypothetical protein VIW69_15105 [Candidatus Elarobacter sp.]
MKAFVMGFLASTGVIFSGFAPSEAASRTPVFQQESVQEFETVLQRNPHRTLESVRNDHAGYRAFKFLDREMVLIGVASAVFVDDRGRLHIVQAHGEPMGGHPNVTHEEYSHILIPPGVVLPR